MAAPKKLNKEVNEAMDKAMAGALHANGIGPSPQGDKSTAAAEDIQKKGFSYNGDSNNSFGLGGRDSVFNFSGGGSSYLSLRNAMVGFNPLGFGLTSYNMNGAGGSLASSHQQRTHVAHVKMGFAVEAYKGFGVVKNVIDLMCNFASEGLSIHHPRPNIQKFYRQWAEKVGLQSRSKDALRQYYKTSNVFIYTNYGKIDDTVYRKVKRRGKANSLDPLLEERMDDAESESTKPEGERLIPWRYTLLNPFQMHMEGPSYFGQKRWLFKLDPETVNSINSEKSIDYLGDTEQNLPPEFIAAKDGLVRLDNKKLWTLHYMKDDHEDWADPMIWPVIGDVIYKNKLRAMDMSVCDSAISAVTIFKLGNLKEGFIPPEEHFRKFAEMLRAPTSAMNMVWYDAIDVVSSYPPVEKILGTAKYESVDNDILKGLGIPEVLMGGGKGGNFSSSFLGVRTLLERLEEGREEILKWINSQLRLIAKTMGHRDVPTVRFGQMSLRDETAEKQLILQLFDRNIISIEAVLDVFGQDFDIEKERLKNEKNVAETDNVMVKHSPYPDPIMNDKEDMKEMSEHEAKQKAKTTKNAQNINGRPGGSKGVPQKKKRSTKPKGMASIVDYERMKVAGRTIYEFIEGELTSRMLRLKNIAYKKSLASADRELLDKLIFATFSNAQTSFEMTAEAVNTIIKQSGGAANEFVKQSYAALIGADDKLSQDEKRINRIAAWAACQLEDSSD